MSDRTEIIDSLDLRCRNILFTIFYSPENKICTYGKFLKTLNTVCNGMLIMSTATFSKHLKHLLEAKILIKTYLDYHTLQPVENQDFNGVLPLASYEINPKYLDVIKKKWVT